MPTKITAAAALALFALGCVEAGAAPPPGDPQSHAHDHLQATALAGPYPTIDAACAAALSASGLPARPCTGAPVALTGAPFRAALLRSEDKTDPRYAGSGAFFLALGDEGAWFVTAKPLDQQNGAAGKMYLPVLAPAAAQAVTTNHVVRVLLRFTDATTSVCNACEGPERDKRTPVQTNAIVLVCDRDRAGKAACTAPQQIDEKATSALAPDGLLSLGAPGAAAKVYEVVF